MADGSIPIQLNDLSSIIEGEFLDSEFDRGRYATDASIYQMMPHAVILPKTQADIENIINTCQGIYEDNKTKTNFFVGTHGNRLKAALGIKGIDIANCFCLKISLNKTEILFDGFKMYEGDRIGRAHRNPVHHQYLGYDSDQDEDEKTNNEWTRVFSRDDITVRGANLVINVLLHPTMVIKFL